jgi:hypothetical protein
MYAISVPKSFKLHRHRGEFLLIACIIRVKKYQGYEEKFLKPVKPAWLRFENE